MEMAQLVRLYKLHIFLSMVLICLIFFHIKASYKKYFLIKMDKILRTINIKILFHSKYVYKNLGVFLFSFFISLLFYCLELNYLENETNNMSKTFLMSLEKEYITPK
jgi:hypothetical protein